MSIREQIVKAFQRSAPGVCNDSPKNFASIDKMQWHIETTASGGTIGVVLCPKSHGNYRLMGVGAVGATKAESIAYAKQVLRGLDVYAYDPGPCEYQTILSQLPVEIRSIPCES